MPLSYSLVLIFICLLVILVWPFWTEFRRPAIGVAERRNSDGDFVRLSQGITHYRWTGPARGPVAVVLHGMASPMETMQAVAEGLNAIGYRVLLYDLYGRGLSDAPRGRQDRGFFLQQLRDLLAFHKLEEDVTLVGYSLGGSIATAYAAQNPYMIKRVILLAPTGVVVNETRLAAFCRRRRILGDWAHAVFIHGRIKRSIPPRGQTKEIETVLRAQRRDLNRRGYLPALLASRRGLLADVQEKDHRMLGRKGMPVFAIWAGQDRIIPLRALGKLAEWNRNARHEVVEEADHSLPYTHSAELIAALRDTLRN